MAYKDPIKEREYQRVYQRKWRAENRGKVSTYWKRFAEGHREYNLNRAREWNKANRDKRYTYDSKYSKTHREKRRLGAHNWYKRRSATSIVKQTIRRQKRRALEKKAIGYFCEGDIKMLFRQQAGCCAYCLEPIAYGQFHIDHVIPLSKGGTNWRRNLALTCATCNLSKGNKLGYTPSWVFPA